jgi:hypothetical protein
MVRRFGAFDILHFVRRILAVSLLVVFAVGFSPAEDVSFHRIKVPDAKGRPIQAVLTFSDTDKAIAVHPVKGGDPVTIPYAEIDDCSYEYTKKHQVSDATIATVPIGIGAVAMIRKSTTHWLEIHYTEQDVRHTYVVQMDKHNYLRVLEAVKKHTGKDAEVLGNADKRR